jgi:hypothetical protein
MSNPYLGTWHIIEMEQWDQDYIDLVVPGYISFRKDQRGEFQFGAVHGDFDYHIVPYQNTERLEFSWEVFYAAVPLDHGKELRDRLPYILLQQWGV